MIENEPEISTSLGAPIDHLPNDLPKGITFKNTTISKHPSEPALAPPADSGMPSPAYTSAAIPKVGTNTHEEPLQSEHHQVVIQPPVHKEKTILEQLAEDEAEAQAIIDAAAKAKLQSAPAASAGSAIPQTAPPASLAADLLRPPVPPLLIKSPPPPLQSTPAPLMPKPAPPVVISPPPLPRPPAASQLSKLPPVQAPKPLETPPKPPVPLKPSAPLVPHTPQPAPPKPAPSPAPFKFKPRFEHTPEIKLLHKNEAKAVAPKDEPNKDEKESPFNPLGPSESTPKLEVSKNDASPLINAAPKDKPADKPASDQPEKPQLKPGEIFIDAEGNVVQG